MASKDKSVTLTKNGRKVTLTIPQDIVQYRAAGWREEEAKAAETPEADSPQDDPKSSEDSAAGANPRSASAQTAKGGSKK